MRDEIMIERLSCAYDREMSRMGNGLYDDTYYPDPFAAAPYQPEIPDHESTARVISPDEWNLILNSMTDEERAALEYER